MRNNDAMHRGNDFAIYLDATSLRSRLQLEMHTPKTYCPFLLAKIPPAMQVFCIRPKTT
jgi:hypothetical protein